MISIGALLTIACAVAAVENISPNDTNTDQQVLKRLTTFLNTTSNIEPRDIDRLNRTAQKLGLDRDLIAKLAEKLKNDSTNIKKIPDSGYNVYDDGAGKSETPKLNAVDESPDYASSVVLASDLLSLTSAVANVKEKECREQGYRFLDGLILNKRWALKSLTEDDKFQAHEESDIEPLNHDSDEDPDFNPVASSGNIDPEISDDSSQD
ncbi:unnamed protein product [Euphydryas editha]|uniref:Secreted protein n=1 Tax=Euphydryas editha TaxID=104508 RepID=A0AAU9U4J9_EUPED|nr:unnamed protein product [Euphydryas editha]